MINTQQAPDLAIVARIKKLLNLSRDGGASESEVEQARAHAQRLMMEHNVSIATAEAADTSHTNVRRKNETTKGRAMYDWQRGLMWTLCRVNFCSCLNEYNWSGRNWRTVGFQIIGREENVVAVTTTFDYLRQAVERTAREYVGGDHHRLLSNEAMSFKEGASSRLQERINDQFREALRAQRAEAERARANGDGKALVVVMEDYAEVERCLNEDFRRGVAPGTTAHEKFVSSVQSKAFMKATEIMQAAGTKDRELLEQASIPVVKEMLAASGLTPEEQAATLDQAINMAAGNATTTTKQRRGGRRYRYTGGSQKDVNWSAHSDGGSAANRISLNKQVDTGSTAKLIG